MSEWQMPQYCMSIKMSVGPTSRRANSNASNLASGPCVAKPFVEIPCVAVAVIRCFSFCSVYCGDHFQFDRDGCRKAGDLNRGSARLIVGEVFGVDPIIYGKISFHIR